MLITKLKIFLILLLLIISNKNSIAQKSSDKLREIKEFKNILKDFTNVKPGLLFFNESDGLLRLPSHFMNYNGYYDNINFDGKIDSFTISKSYAFNLELTKSDCNELNNAILNDTNRLYFQKSWFKNKKIELLTDSEMKDKNNRKIDYMKPIFFRNYSRCFIAIYSSGFMESYFLRKRNRKWIFDKNYLIVYDY